MFRFTIRDMLWLTVPVGIGVAWGIDHGRQVRENGAWQTAATLLYGDVQRATGTSPQWEILGKPWPPNLN
jgi:hypothetical protein